MKVGVGINDDQEVVEDIFETQKKPIYKNLIDLN